MVVTPLRPPTGTGAFLWIVLPSPSWPKPLSPQAQGVDGTAATFAVAADPPTGLARTHPAATAAPTRLTQDHVDISSSLSHPAARPNGLWTGPRRNAEADAKPSSKLTTAGPRPHPHPAHPGARAVLPAGTDIVAEPPRRTHTPPPRPHR